MKLKELLKPILTEEEIAIMPMSFDSVGDIIIFNSFPEELESKEKEIGEIIINSHKNIHIVAKKTGIYSGVFRTPEIKVIAGEDRKETIHKENDTRLKLNIETTYFSTRTSNERKRIFQMVKPGENILVMFSGIAPLPCIIARNAEPKYILGVEINPEAHKYAEENIKLNKLKNVEVLNGDVREVLPTIDKEFDRILMPLPKTAEEFLDIALTKIKDKGIIHLYSFISPTEIPNMEKTIKKYCKEVDKTCKILEVAKCGQFSPEEDRVCFDIQVN